MKRIVLLPALALVAVGTAITAFWPSVQRTPPASRAITGTSAPLVIPATADTPPAESAQPALPHAPELMPAAIAATFPGLVHRIADWREYLPAKVTVEVSPGCPLDFEQTQVSEVDGHAVWSGTNPAIPGATYVSVATADTYFANISLPGTDDYSVYIHGDQIATFNRASGTCPTAPNPVSVYNETAHAFAAAESINTVDVLFCYREEARAFLNDTDANVKAYLESQAIALVTQSNLYLAQSGVDNLRWRSLGVVKIAPAVPQPTMAAELEAFASDASVATAMQELAADQAVLFVPSQRGTETGVAGIALCPGQFSAVGMFAGAEVYAHELAHNFGCRHDRSNPATGDSASDNDGHYYYGYQSSYAGVTYGTIMSYADRLPYFSNPSITVSSAVVIAGTNDQLTIGVAAGGAKAADNARWLRERAPSMAATRSPATVPAITSQPGAVAVTAGQTITLTVSATGGNLTYQWHKDGSVIAGATTATYTKAGVTTADSGSYTVVVANTAGTVTSSPATVSVTAPSTPTNGGGGGGGGALSLWATGVLALLSLYRAARTR